MVESKVTASAIRVTLLSSVPDAFFLKTRRYISSENIVLEAVSIPSTVERRAAISPATRSPRMPLGKKVRMTFIKASSGKDTRIYHTHHSPDDE